MAVLPRIMLPVEASSSEVSMVTVGASYPVLLTTRPPIKVGLDGGPILDSFRRESEQNSATGLSLVICNTDEYGLTKPQKWLIEWLRVEDDDKNRALLEDMEVLFRQANMEARDRKMLPEEEDQNLVSLIEKFEKFLSEKKKVVQTRTKGNRELLNLESSINYGIASRPSRRRKGMTIGL
jgi:hypothetical protein